MTFFAAYLCLEDLTYPFRIPCICDVKIGTRQHGDDAAPDKKLRHTAKCENTTSKPLGVRLCGQMVSLSTLALFLTFLCRCTNLMAKDIVILINTKAEK